MSEPQTKAGRSFVKRLHLDERIAGVKFGPQFFEDVDRTILAVEQEASGRAVEEPLDHHPERFCERCGGPNLRWWHAPSPLWNTVMRDTEGREKFGIVCPRCFGELAQEKGVADFFCLMTHEPLVPLPSVFGDGRVWDPGQCRWVARLSVNEGGLAPLMPGVGPEDYHGARTEAEDR